MFFFFFNRGISSFELQDLFMRSTLDSIFEVGFGEELDTLSGLSEEGNRFAKAFDDSSDLILWRYVDIFWKIKRFLGIGSEADLKKNIVVIDGFAYKLIHRKALSMSDQQNDAVSWIKIFHVCSRKFHVPPFSG